MSTLTAAEYERYLARRRARVAAGLPPSDLVDADPVRDHIRSLMAAGRTVYRIADAAGVPRSNLSGLLYDIGRRSRRYRIVGDTAARLLALRPADVPLGTALDVGTQRRLQALVADGHNATRLSRGLHMGFDHLLGLLHGSRAVRPGTAAAIRELYAALACTPPPQRTAGQRRSVERARAVAAEHGWRRAIAWDDDTIDDPEARPAEDVRLDAPRKARVHLDDVAHLRRFDVPDEEIARRLRVEVESIAEAERRARRRGCAA